MTDLSGFRGLFPALERVTYLNTPTAPPGARPVLDAIREALREWESGEFSWQRWEREAQATRGLFASLIGADEGSVALMSSVAEGASTAAATVRTGRVVVGEREFRSNLLPWLALRSRGVEVATVPETDGVLRGEALADAVDASTVLVAVSEVQSSTGVRVDLEPVAAAVREAGARLFVNLTQSLGALRFSVDELEPDFVVAHGYKWLLGARGTAWLYVRPDRAKEVEPLLPNWHSFDDPYADYYGDDELAADARRLDSSISWFPWVGSRAALEILRSFSSPAIEERALALSAAFRDGAHGLGVGSIPEERRTQTVSVDVPDAESLKQRLAESRVIGAVRDGRLRLGFHAFNDESDVDAALRALAAVR